MQTPLPNRDVRIWPIASSCYLLLSDCCGPRFRSGPPDPIRLRPHLHVLLPARRAPQLDGNGQQRRLHQHADISREGAGLKQPLPAAMAVHPHALTETLHMGEGHLLPGIVLGDGAPRHRADLRDWPTFRGVLAMCLPAAFGVKGVVG